MEERTNFGEVYVNQVEFMFDFWGYTYNPEVRNKQGAKAWIYEFAHVLSRNNNW